MEVLETVAMVVPDTASTGSASEAGAAACDQPTGRTANRRRAWDFQRLEALDWPVPAVEEGAADECDEVERSDASAANSAAAPESELAGNSHKEEEMEETSEAAKNVVPAAATTTDALARRGWPHQHLEPSPSATPGNSRSSSGGRRVFNNPTFQESRPASPEGTPTARSAGHEYGSWGESAEDSAPQELALENPSSKLPVVQFHGRSIPPDAGAARDARLLLISAQAGGMLHEMQEEWERELEQRGREWKRMGRRRSGGMATAAGFDRHTPSSPSSSSASEPGREALEGAEMEVEVVRLEAQALFSGMERAQALLQKQLSMKDKQLHDMQAALLEAQDELIAGGAARSLQPEEEEESGSQGDGQEHHLDAAAAEEAVGLQLQLEQLQLQKMEMQAAAAAALRRSEEAERETLAVIEAAAAARIEISGLLEQLQEEQGRREELEMQLEQQEEAMQKLADGAAPPGAPEGSKAVLLETGGERSHSDCNEKPAAAAVMQSVANPLFKADVAVGTAFGKGAWLRSDDSAMAAFAAAAVAAEVGLEEHGGEAPAHRELPVPPLTPVPSAAARSLVSSAHGSASESGTPDKPQDTGGEVAPPPCSWGGAAAAESGAAEEERVKAIALDLAKALEVLELVTEERERMGAELDSMRAERNHLASQLADSRALEADAQRLRHEAEAAAAASVPLEVANQLSEKVTLLQEEKEDLEARLVTSSLAVAEAHCQKDELTLQLRNLLKEQAVSRRR